MHSISKNGICIKCIYTINGHCRKINISLETDRKASFSTLFRRVQINVIFHEYALLEYILQQQNIPHHRNTE